MRALRRDQILPLAVGSMAAAALGTIPLHRLPRPLQIGYVVVPAILTTVISHAAQGSRDHGQDGEDCAGTLTADPATTAPEARAGTGAADDVELELEEPASKRFRLVLSLGFGTFIAGAGVAGIWIDHRVEDALRSRGVPAPRVVIGLMTGVLTAVLTTVDTHDAEPGTLSESSSTELGRSGPR